MLLVEGALVYCGGGRTSPEGSLLLSQVVILVELRVLLDLHEVPPADHATLPFLGPGILCRVDGALLLDPWVRDVGVLALVHMMSVLLETADEALRARVLLLPQPEDLRVLRILTQIGSLVNRLRRAFVVLHAVLVT